MLAAWVGLRWPVLWASQGLSLPCWWSASGQQGGPAPGDWQTVRWRSRGQGKCLSYLAGCPCCAPGHQQVSRRTSDCLGPGLRLGHCPFVPACSTIRPRPAGGEKLHFLIRGAEGHAQRSTDLGGVSGAAFGEDPPEALSGTTQAEQSDEHLVLLGRRIKEGGQFLQDSGGCWASLPQPPTMWASSPRGNGKGPSYYARHSSPFIPEHHLPIGSPGKLLSCSRLCSKTCRDI